MKHTTCKYWRYRLATILLLAMFSAIAVQVSAQQITTFILLRHAEKVRDGSKDPALTTEGKARAMRLSALLDKTSVDVVYTTHYQRTRATVEPLAKSKALDIREYEPSQEAVIDEMLSRHQGKTILVCGHSDTIPEIANWLTGSQQFQEFDDADFGNLFVISLVSKGSAAKVTWLRY